MKMSSHSFSIFKQGSLALAHNGNLVNANQLKSQLEAQGSIFQTSSDTEVLAHLIRRGGHTPFKERVKNALSMIKGAYAFLIMTEDRIDGGTRSKWNASIINW